ncbi:hypothetical protein HDU98_000964 [Podochytrium sp. JEL0797]|nr:hypothetical protein HDU98_000964 [Podochytrium sp. JEL0797]
MELAKSLVFGATSSPTTPETRTPTTPRLVFATKVFIFVVLFFTAPLASCLLGIPLLPLYFIHHTLFRRAMRQIEKAFASFCMIVTYIFLPGTTIVITGDGWHQMDPADKMIVMANHQIYPDWLTMWYVAWSRNLHADMRVFLIKILSLLPLFGQGMQMFEWVFLNQNLEKDREIIRGNLETARKDVGVPLWLLIFPEGTLNTPGNVAKSRVYAEKMGISPHPQHCILPKSTGLYLSLQHLTPTVTSLFDMTVGYSGISGTEIPYDALLPDKMFFHNQYPREIHFHIDRYDVRTEVPGFRVTDQLGSGVVREEDEAEVKKEFDLWLRTVWMRKDERLVRFYADGEMPRTEGGRVERIPIVPRWNDWVCYLGLLVGGAVMVPVYWWVFMRVLEVAWSVILVGGNAVVDLVHG